MVRINKILGVIRRYLKVKYLFLIKNLYVENIRKALEAIVNAHNIIETTAELSNSEYEKIKFIDSECNKDRKEDALTGGSIHLCKELYDWSEAKAGKFIDLAIRLTILSRKEFKRAYIIEGKRDFIL